MAVRQTKKNVRSQKPVFSCCYVEPFFNNAQPPTGGSFAHCMYLVFISFRLLILEQIAYPSIFRPRLSRRDWIFSIMPALFVTLGSTGVSMVSGRGNLRLGVGTHTSRSLLRLLR